MDSEKLIAGYVLRVTVRRNRWRIHLHNIATQQVKVFGSFEALGEYLEKVTSTPKKTSLTLEPFVPEREE